MSYVKKTLMTLLACSLLVGTAAVAGAQSQGVQGQQGQAYTQSQPTPQQEGPALSGQQLDKVADAYVDIRDIQTEVEEKLADVESSDRAKDIQSKGYEKMIMVVEKNGLDVPSYNKALQEIQADPRLQAQFQQKVNAEQ